MRKGAVNVGERAVLTWDDPKHSRLMTPDFSCYQGSWMDRPAVYIEYRALASGSKQIITILSVEGWRDMFHGLCWKLQQMQFRCPDKWEEAILRRKDIELINRWLESTTEIPASMRPGEAEHVFRMQEAAEV